MLLEIDIRDVATIDALNLTLKRGTTMITGETGAGKSIFIEAIELGLGGRSTQALIRPGKEKAEISLRFDISNFPHVITYLKAQDLYDELSECLIRRVITQDGRSRSYINGRPATLQSVKELGEFLFHLHGQYEQQVLLKSEKQREMLDRFGGHLTLAHETETIAFTIKEKTTAISTLQAAQKMRDEKSQFLQFQLEELSKAVLKPGEWEQLETDHKRFANADALIKDINHINQLLEENIFNHAHDIRKRLDGMINIEKKAQAWQETLQSATLLLNDLQNQLEDYLNQLELDPQKLQGIEERISHLFTLARKHKISPPDLPHLLTQLQTDLKQLESVEEKLAILTKEKEMLKLTYQNKSAILSEQRKIAAARLSKEVTATIRTLSLPYGEFQIELEQQKEETPIHGNEKIHFLIKTNPDQPLRPLAKVISGGELSRLSLALHLALTENTTIPTLIFDEVDTGLSGATAEKIGRLLKKLGASYQVFCVTHQHQVAASSDHHLFVEKYFNQDGTHTQLRFLQDEEKIREIARLLGGEILTEKTLMHAKEVLEQYAS